MSLSILSPFSKSSTVRVAASFFGLCQKGSAAALMVVFCLLSFFFLEFLHLLVLELQRKREGGGMPSSELRWTLLDRDQKKRWQQRRGEQQIQYFQRRGVAQKKLFARLRLCVCVACGRVWKNKLEFGKK
jgi:hypothetical protein